jgi:Domain of unknown function (DUF4365)
MAARKKRTTEHVIADMSLHYLAYLIAKAGFTFEATRADYGYDGFVITFDADGEVENGLVYVQLKATNKIRVHNASSSVLFGITRKDLDLWGSEQYPVYLVLFDAQAEVAYWLYLQKYLEANRITASAIKGKSLEVRIAKGRSLDLAAVGSWRSDKARALAKVGVVPHA